MTRTGSSRKAWRSSAGSHPVSVPARKGRPQVAEHDSEREDREERERAEALQGGAGRPGGEPGEQSVPFDEEAAWAAIVAGYGD
ncbi:MAG TPA: hypothetical protein VK545_12900, partial [Streptomyces sp.]|nr:hypothetical protein [Streptomyces sp.]